MANPSEGCTLAAFCAAKNLPLKLCRDAGITEITYDGRPALRIPYFDQHGEEVAVQRRLLLHKPPPPAKDRRFNWTSGSKVRFYGLDRLKDAKDFVVLVEGVSDCLTAWLHDVPAIGIPGAGTGKTCLARSPGALDGVGKVVVLVEPDDGGTGVLDWLASRPFGDRAHVVFMEDAGDLSALYLADPTLFGMKFMALVDAAKPFDELHDHPRVEEVLQKQDQRRQQEPPKRAGKVSLATKLVDLALQPDVALYRTATGEAFVVLGIAGHLETHLVRSRGFRTWLAQSYYATAQAAVNAGALADAVAMVESIAVNEGALAAVSLRVAAGPGTLYLDLADEAWRCVEITARGWTVRDDAPVRFRRPAGMQALPEPVPGGSLDDLRAFLNVADDDWPLLIAYLAASYQPTGPYPLLVIGGEQGSAKSSASRVLHRLVDPHRVPLRSTPTDGRDLMIAAKHCWLLAYDNVRQLADWLSDALSRLATGGGFGTRALYTDEDEVLIDVMRPVLVNGITDVITSADLLDRTILLTAPVIPERQRRTEREFWRTFDAACPRLLGAVCDLLAKVIRLQPAVTLQSPPRMADFATTGVAVELAVEWPAGTFLAVYRANRSGAHAATLEESPVARFLPELFADGDHWQGTATMLLDRLTGFLPTDAKDRPRYPHDWPKTPAVLSGTLRRIAPALRDTGIEVSFVKVTRSRREIIVENGRVGDSASPASPSSQTRESGLFRDAPVPTVPSRGLSPSSPAVVDREAPGDALGDDRDAPETTVATTSSPKKSNTGTASETRDGVGDDGDDVSPSSLLRRQPNGGCEPGEEG